MSRPLLLLDCDGVMIDFIGPALVVLNELTGKAYTREQVDAWDMMKALGVPADVERQAWDRYKQQGWCEKLPAFAGAVEGVRRLQGVADIYVVTSPMNGPFWAFEREQVLERDFGIHHRKVVSTSAKHLIAGDILVDDKTQTLAEWEKNSHGLAVQWKTPHNVNDGWQGIAVDDWDVLYGIVLGYSARRPCFAKLMEW